MGKHWTLPPRTEEHKRKIGEAQRKRFEDPEVRRKHREARVGQVCTAETKAKIAATAARKWADPEQREKIRADKKRAAGRAVSPTRPEKRMAAILEQSEVPYTFQHRIGPYLADFFVESVGLVIEVDSAYWHERATERDARRDAFIRGLGLKLIRIPADFLTGRVLKADLARVVPPCVVCGDSEEKTRRRGRCNACSAFFGRNGSERPPELWGRKFSAETRARMAAAYRKRTAADGR